MENPLNNEPVLVDLEPNNGALLEVPVLTENMDGAGEAVKIELLVAVDGVAELTKIELLVVVAPKIELVVLEAPKIEDPVEDMELNNVDEVVVTKEPEDITGMEVLLPAERLIAGVLLTTEEVTGVEICAILVLNDLDVDEDSVEEFFGSGKELVTVMELTE